MIIRNCKNGKLRSIDIIEGFPFTSKKYNSKIYGNLLIVCTPDELPYVCDLSKDEWIFKQVNWGIKE